MAFVDYDLSVALQRCREEGVLHSGKRLDNGNVEASVRLVRSASDASDVAL